MAASDAYYQDPLPCPSRLVYQLVGGDAALLAKAAGLLDARETAGIDINMGCSAPEIVRTGAGVSWMAHEEASRAMIAGVRKAVKGRLSVKMRLGADENLERLVRFAQMLQNEGVQAITLHPRTSTEKLKGRARWALCGESAWKSRISPSAAMAILARPKSSLSRAKGPVDGAAVKGRGCCAKTPGFLPRLGV
ncbi:hypothetical protein MASR2M78_25920 [Treponema sp.]